jgi:hypothetical protein
MIVCCLLAQAPSLPKGTELHYDKFQDNSLIELDLGQVMNDAGTHFLSIWAVHKGKEPQEARFVTFYVYRHGRDWEYLKHHGVAIVCGERRLNIYKAGYDSELDTKSGRRDNCHEFFNIDLPSGYLQAVLEQDKDLEIKLGDHDPITIGPKARGKMLRFVKAVRSGAY